MGEKEDKEKAEKLAAAKKRVAQLQKKKKAAAGGSKTKDKGETTSTEKDEADETPQSPVTAEVPAESSITDPSTTATIDTTDPNVTSDLLPSQAIAEDDDEDTALFNNAIRNATQTGFDIDSKVEDSPTSTPLQGQEIANSKARSHPARQPSISLQSKARSASFRHGVSPSSPGPEDEEIQNIYQKQIARIDELEKENKRLVQEAQTRETRWRKTEEELEDLRERAADIGNTPAIGESDGTELQRLRAEVETLRRRASVPTIKPADDDATLRKDIESRDSTISDLQLEISRLRSQLTTQTTSTNSSSDQISALQASLARSESTTSKLQTELADTKKSLNRASEKAVTDGTTLTSKDTRIKELERELSAASAAKTEADKRIENLSGKIEAMNKLHRETEQRNAPKLASHETTMKELQASKQKLETLEKELLRLRERHKRSMDGGDGGADADIDDLENEAVSKLQQKVRDLESENFDLRRGVWRDRRRELQPNLSLGADAVDVEDDFDEVDLNGSSAVSRKQSAQQQPKHSGFTQVLNSGLSAFLGAQTQAQQQQQAQSSGRPRNDSLLLDDDEDASFDEAAFAAAQREEEMKKMVEHVREVKKGLKQWKGFRLDLVESRRAGAGGSGFGEIFEV